MLVTGLILTHGALLAIVLRGEQRRREAAAERLRGAMMAEDSRTQKTGEDEDSRRQRLQLRSSSAAFCVQDPAFCVQNPAFCVQLRSRSAAFCVQGPALCGVNATSKCCILHFCILQFCISRKVRWKVPGVGTEVKVNDMANYGVPSGEMDVLRGVTEVQILRSAFAAFCVQLRSESCVQLRSAFSCVLRSGSCVLRSDDVSLVGKEHPLKWAKLLKVQSVALLSISSV
eukprot:gene12050-biopygen3857